MLPEIESVRGEPLSGALEAERLTRPGVQFPGDRIQRFLGEAAQVTPLGQVLPQQAVGVFVDPTLPGTFGIGQGDLRTGGLGQPLMFGHFPAQLVGPRQALLGLDTVEQLAQALPCRFGTITSRNRGCPRL